MAKKKNGKAAAKPKGKARAVGLRAPLAQGSRERTGLPHQRNTVHGIRVRHTEQIGAVAVQVDSNGSAQLYQQRTYRLNAGDADTFPWLAGVAKDYEYYKFHALVFRYKSRVNATTDGIVACAIDTDPADPAPVGLKELRIMPNSVQSPVWDRSAECRAITKALNNFSAGGGLGYYVASDDEPQGSDIRFIDCGQFFIATEGLPYDHPSSEERVIADLEVTYDVELSMPNTEKRLVVNGQAPPVGSPPSAWPTYWINEAGRLLPKLSKLVSTAVDHIVVPGTPYSVPFRWMTSMVKANQLGKDLTWRNALQFWDSAESAFRLAAGKYKLTTKTLLDRDAGVATSDVVSEVVQEIKHHRPGGATQTVGQSCNTRTLLAAHNHDEYDTITTEAIIDCEDGDLVWPEVKASQRGAGPFQGLLTIGGDRSVILEQLGL